MVTSKIKELQALQARAATLQVAIEAERNQELASLPGKYGFESTAAFIQAVRKAEDAIAPGRGAAKKKAAGKSAVKASGAAPAKRKTREDYTGNQG